MITEQTLIGFVMLSIGGLYVVRPDIVLRYRVWSQKVFMGAKYKPTKRTHKIIQAIGVIFMILGLAATVGILY